MKTEMTKRKYYVGFKTNRHNFEREYSKDFSENFDRDVYFLIQDKAAYGHIEMRIYRRDPLYLTASQAESIRDTFEIIEDGPSFVGILHPEDIVPRAIMDENITSIINASQFDEEEARALSEVDTRLAKHEEDSDAYLEAEGLQ